MMEITATHQDVHCESWEIENVAVNPEDDTTELAISSPILSGIPFSTLPVELISHIGSFLPLRDLNRFELVNKETSTAIRHSFPALRELTYAQTSALTIYSNDHPQFIPKL